ncbi:hypothetical protein GC089_09140 [Cellulomonas sp. JZ18]|uniref:DUF6541 family protein n=1 Tax=Cellulomonas sp. JZ18 TaxID=2654191 RepID=UPI0012D395E8|nr:DUF6541 family protein [Cellulomonas sp. JZ18]QGQ19367.1 hypothetical protein GC089_09140 [Cellulomonas sp. JZ18]
MTWTAAVPTVAVGLLALWLPGTLVAASWGVRGRLWLLATAPVLTLAVCGAVPLLLRGLPVAWSWPVAAGGTVALALTGLAVRRWVDRAPVRRTARPAVHAEQVARAQVREQVPAQVPAQVPGSPRRVPTALRVALPAAAALPAAVVALALGRPDRLVSGYDVPVHLNAVALVRRTGAASSLDVSAVNDPALQPREVDAAAWHALTALLPNTAPAVTFLVSVLVATVVVWPLATTALTAATFPRRPALLPWAALASVAGVAVPVELALGSGGMVPNGVALAVLPAVLALVLRAARDRTWAAAGLAVVAAGGLALTHPLGLVSLLVVLLPAAVAVATRAVRTRPPLHPVRLAVLVGAGALPLAALLVSAHPRMSGVLRFEPDAPLPLASALGELLGVKATGVGLPVAAPVVVVALLAAWWSRRVPHARPLAAAAALTFVLLACSMSSVPVLTDLDRPWYGEPRRIAPVLAAVLVPFAALGLRATARAGAARLRRVAGRASLRSPAPAVVAVAVLCGLLGAGATAQDLRDRHVTGPTAVAGDAELDALTTVDRGRVGDAVVVGAALSGTAHLFAVTGIDVLPRTPFAADTPQWRYLRTHLDELAPGSTACSVADDLGVGFVYVDPTVARAGSVDPQTRRLPTSALTPVLHAGPGTLYAITGCAA